LLRFRECRTVEEGAATVAGAATAEVERERSIPGAVTHVVRSTEAVDTEAVLTLDLTAHPSLEVLCCYRQALISRLLYITSGLMPRILMPLFQGNRLGTTCGLFQGNRLGTSGALCQSVTRKYVKMNYIL
jgi:hypothetical protein